MEEGITAALLVCCLTDAADCRADLSLPVSSVMLKRTTFGMRERGVGGEGRGGEAPGSINHASMVWQTDNGLFLASHFRLDSRRLLYIIQVRGTKPRECAAPGCHFFHSCRRACKGEPAPLWLAQITSHDPTRLTGENAIMLF